MKNSFSHDVNENILYPGIVLYDKVIKIDSKDIDSILSMYFHTKENYEKYEVAKVKNTFFYALNKINKRDLAENIQKAILYYFAKYCELYPEAIHAIQWQENIFTDVEFAGEQSFIFNPNKSFMDDENNIKNTPFSRQVVVEVCVDDNYSGGSAEWIYLDDVKISNFNKGSILIYPANYLFSKKHNTIMNGRKILLTTFFNGGKDFLSEENALDESANLSFSYMR